MCGIVGYTGKRDCTGIILSCLKKLEYRGYDSAGLAVIDREGIEVRRCKGKIASLEEKVRTRPCRGSTGIGHTRWATHGRPSEENAHPHVEGPIAVVHNGIIENHLEIKRSLEKEGARFRSETDSEVIAHLICRFVRQGMTFEDAVFKALSILRGSWAIAVLKGDEPGKLIGARQECPLVVGLGGDEYFLASDIPAILEYTREIVFLEDGEVVVIDEDGPRFFDRKGERVDKRARRIDWTPAMAEKGGYRHFMEKEIFEQPRAVIDTIRGRVSEEEGRVYLDETGLSEEDTVKRVSIVACGTSWHAGLVGKFMIEGIARLPVEVDIASEFRYREPLVDRETLLIPISQSGETADTLAATRLGRDLGAKVIAICNVIESSIARASHGVLYTHAGPEIGVASTKAFTTQIVALYLMALYLAQLRGRIDSEGIRERIGDLLRVPSAMESVLSLNDAIGGIAREYFKYKDFLYLGRGINYPIALEGALKLKEISYIHAEGYPAGEMKHGPIALIDENMPTMAIAVKDRAYEKMLGNIEEVRARGGRVIALVTEGDGIIGDKASKTIALPPSDPFLSPLITVLPLQIFAYHVAVLRGTDVDQPRNLAKSVTVE